MSIRVRLILSAGMAATWASLVACAPASLGSPPPGERSLQCRTGETVVCRTRDVSRVGNEKNRENDWCICESVNNGLRY